MTLKSLDPSTLPAKTRAPRVGKFSDDELASAILELKDGQAVVPNEDGEPVPFKTEGAARRFALLLRGAIQAHPDADFGKDLAVSTRVWNEGEDWFCAVLLRERRGSKKK
jgi:hypothetical protein